MRLSTLRRRTTGATVALLTAAAALTAAPAASAAQAAPAGRAAAAAPAAVNPATGTDTSSMDVTTPAACPEPATNVIVLLKGKGFRPEGKIAVGNSPIATYARTPAGGIVVPLTYTLRDYASEEGFSKLEGRYDLTVVCRKAFGSATYGEFTGPLWFTSDTAYQTTAPVAATTTALAASPAGSSVEGAKLTLTATVAPAAAAGTVTFLDGAAVLGAPVAVAAGKAVFATTALKTGAHSLTARFAPADPAAYAPSASAALAHTVKIKPPVLVTAPKLTGTARVASTLTCAVTYSGAVSVGYQWLSDGRVVPGTARTRKLADADYKHKIACKTTGTNTTGNTSATSPAVTVAVGPALKNTVRPSITGTARVGATLRAKAGTWTPAATSYTYVWKRDGRVISGATRSSYTAVRADRGHLLTVTVTAKRTAYTNGAATSGSLRVR